MYSVKKLYFQAESHMRLQPCSEAITVFTNYTEKKNSVHAQLVERRWQFIVEIYIYINIDGSIT